MSHSAFEIRLCSLPLARWLDRRSDGQGEPLGPLGSMFDGVFRRAQGQEVPVTPVASRGVRFESVDFAASVIHAVAVAAAATDGDTETADDVEQFLRGEVEYGAVPKSLRREGVYSVMAKSEALEIASWMKKVDPTVYEREARSMFGVGTTAYLAAGRDLQGVFESVTVHGADICCWAAS